VGVKKKPNNLSFFSTSIINIGGDKRIRYEAKKKPWGGGGGGGGGGPGEWGGETGLVENQSGGKLTNQENVKGCLSLGKVKGKSERDRECFRYTKKQQWGIA